LPRAELAVDLREVTPVPVKNPTLLANKDPYNSLKPTLKPEPTPTPEMQTAESQKVDNGIDGSANKAQESAPEIRKALPVQPQDKEPAEIRRALPVKPLDQESAEETLLKSATPPPSDLDQ